MILSLPRLGLLACFLTTLSACGSSYETVKIKDYRLAVLDDDPAVTNEFRNLMHDFNYFAGMDVISFSETASGANSAVMLVKDLRKNSKDDNIGFGQWIADTDEDDSLVTTPGEKRQRVIRYSMRIQLDQEYVRNEMAKDNTASKRKLQILFFHEVGHGLEMDHHPSAKDDVMYYDVSGDKNFDTFFGRVSSYMSDRDS